MGVIMVGHEMAHVLSNYIAGQKQGVFTYAAPLIVQESFSHFGEALLEQEMLQRAESPVEKARVRLAFFTKEFDALTILPAAKFEEDLYALIASKGNTPATFDEINDLFKKDYACLQQLTGEDQDVRNLGLWNMLMQPPHTGAVYPITKIMAGALHDELEKNPEQFRKRYHEIMEAGANMGVATLWNTLLGNGIAEQKGLIEARIDSLVDSTAAIKEEIAALPTIKKPEEEVSEGSAAKPDDEKPTADASNFPVIGSMTGAMAQRKALKSRKATIEKPTAWQDRPQTPDSAEIRR